MKLLILILLSCASASFLRLHGEAARQRLLKSITLRQQKTHTRGAFGCKVRRSWKRSFLFSFTSPTQPIEGVRRLYGGKPEQSAEHHSARYHESFLSQRVVEALNVFSSFLQLELKAHAPMFARSYRRLWSKWRATYCASSLESKTLSKF